jgi:hypothetical protein
MDSTSQQLLQGASGAGGDEKPMLENMFRINTYAGDSNASTSIVNGLNMAKGGMVMTKAMNDGKGWDIRDTVRGPNSRLRCNETNAVDDAADDGGITEFTFNSNGYNPGNGTGTEWTNKINVNYQSLSIRKHKGLFDVVEYTGDGSASNQIAHELECIPGMIWVKDQNADSNWICWHMELNMGNNREDYYVKLNSSDQQVSSSDAWASTVPTSTHFTVGNFAETNTNGNKYIAYIFAGGGPGGNIGGTVFGPNEDEYLCSTGWYTGNSGSQVISSVGFEPEFIILKCFSDNDNQGGQWAFLNTQLGFGFNAGNDSIADGIGLQIDTTSQATQYFRIWPNVQTSGGGGIEFRGEGWWNSNSYKYFYWAVKGPNSKISASADDGAVGTDYLQMAAGNNSGNSPDGCFLTTNGFAPDFRIRKENAATSKWEIGARSCSYWEWNTDTYDAGTKIGSLAASSTNWQSSKGMDRDKANSWQAWMWKRGPGFYENWTLGTGSSRWIYHQLRAVPEMVMIKNVEKADQYTVGHKDMNEGSNPWNYYLETNSMGPNSASATLFNNTGPDINGVQVGSNSITNENNKLISMQCFRSVNGISKVGSYTGNGVSGHAITLGFQPRFMWIKCESHQAAWYIWDSFNGDYSLDWAVETARQSSTFISATSSGFEIMTASDSRLNTDTRHYLYYAHA